MEFTYSAQGTLASVRKADVPGYLQAGEFFQSLHVDDPDETIDVPSNALKPTRTVTSIAELAHLLTSLRFWVVVEPVLDAVGFILANKGDCETVVDEFVADFPYLRVFQVIPDHEHNTPMDNAIINGGLSMVKLMHQLREEFSEEEAPILVARSGNLDILKFARQNGVICGENTFDEACERGHLHIVTYLHNENIVAVDSVPYACVYAAQEGHLEILRFLHTHGYEWGSLCTKDAAAEGHLHCLRYLHEEGCEWDEGAFAGAALNGQLHILQYLHAQNAPYDEGAMNGAAAGGHLDCLLFLQEIGHTWDKDTVRKAASNGHAPTLTYLVAQGCSIGTGALNAALQNKQTECVALLLENGADCTVAGLNAAILNEHVHAVRHIAQVLKMWGTDLYLHAAKVGCNDYLLGALYDLGCNINNDGINKLKSMGMRRAVEYIATLRNNSGGSIAKKNKKKKGQKSG